MTIYTFIKQKVLTKIAVVFPQNLKELKRSDMFAITIFVINSEGCNFSSRQSSILSTPEVRVYTHEYNILRIKPTTTTRSIA